MLFLLKECYQTYYAVTIKIRETVKKNSENLYFHI